MRLTKDEILLVIGILLTLSVGSIVYHYRAHQPPLKLPKLPPSLPTTSAPTPPPEDQR